MMIARNDADQPNRFVFGVVINAIRAGPRAFRSSARISSKTVMPMMVAVVMVVPAMMVVMPPVVGPVMVEARWSVIAGTAVIALTDPGPAIPDRATDQ